MVVKKTVKITSASRPAEECYAEHPKKPTVDTPKKPKYKRSKPKATSIPSGSRPPLRKATVPKARPKTSLLRLRYPPKRELRLQNLEVVRTLGEGGFAAVCSARVRSPEDDARGTTVAVKIQQKKTLVLTSRPRNILAERKFLSNLPWSPFIAGILDVFQDIKNVYYILEFTGLNTLHSERHRRQGGRFTEKEGQFYFSNIVLGLEHLHKHGIAHCDLKPNNILVCDDGYVAIADFGLAKEDTWEFWDSYGSPEYMPPETFDHEKYGPVSTTVDWWSAGCVLYEMIAGERAFSEELKPEDRQRRIVNRQFGSRGICQYCSAGFYELLEGLLVPDSSVRMGSRGVEEIKMVRWLQDISWSALEARIVSPPHVPAVMHAANRWSIPHNAFMPKQEFVPGLRVIEPPAALKYIGGDFLGH